MCWHYRFGQAFDTCARGMIFSQTIIKVPPSPVRNWWIEMVPIAVSYCLQILPREDVLNESDYYKKQKVEFCLTKIESEYADVRKVINNINPINKNKKGRIYSYKNEIQILIDAANKATERIEEKLDAVSSKQGCREEHEFWKKTMNRAWNVGETLLKKIEDVNILVQKVEEVFSPSPAAAIKSRKGSK